MTPDDTQTAMTFNEAMDEIFHVANMLRSKAGAFGMIFNKEMEILLHGLANNLDEASDAIHRDKMETLNKAFADAKEVSHAILRSAMAGCIVSPNRTQEAE